MDFPESNTPFWRAGKKREGIVVCRAGLEGGVMEEMAALGISSVQKGKRAVFFEGTPVDFSVLNQGLRSAIRILAPIRQFRASSYDILYHQARRTNWHQFFGLESRLRIDVTGRSRELDHSQYVIHRVKDGIMDTFRKFHDGQRPYIEKDQPDVHIVVYLDRDHVNLCFDTSGTPLFKRGYRTEHGEAPLKEDLAAGMLWLLGLRPGGGSLVDPMCGGGTFLFEGWMLLSGRAPNRGRIFGMETLSGWQPEFQASSASRLDALRSPHPVRCLGLDIDPEAIAIAERIRSEHFWEAPIELKVADCRDAEVQMQEGFLICNPPYGERMGSGDSDLLQLYAALGRIAKRGLSGGRMGVFSTNRTALKRIGLRPEIGLTLFNGSLEGLLNLYSIR